MKSVVQKDYLGCGVACVAFVVQKSYNQVIQVLGAARARTRGFNCSDLTRGLSKFGLAYDYKYLNSRIRKRIYKNGVIVFIERSKRYPDGHFLVRSNSSWMDPWINFSRDDDASKAKAGFRKRLPGRPIYVLMPLGSTPSYKESVICITAYRAKV